MRFGDPSSFAIDCVHESIPNEEGWVFGRMCIWLDGLRLGDFGQPACMLDVTAGRLMGVINRLPELADPAFDALTDAQLYALLDRSLFREDDRALAQIAADAERYSKFDFLTNGGESFVRFKSFIATQNDQARILFTELDSDLVGARVDSAAFVATITAFLDWLRSEANYAG